MPTQQVPSFFITGLAIRTTNENGQSSGDIAGLWNRFASEGIGEQIPGKIGTELYCVYTDYEKDYTKPYTTVLGCKVASLQHIPAGLTGITIDPGNYSVFKAEGNLKAGAVVRVWQTIWDSGMTRKYTTDFEVYGDKAKDPTHGEVDIFVSIP